MNTFTNKFDENVRPLMDKIDQVRSILLDGRDRLQFPSIVVVGNQSSGKSTLLEALSLVELPKGKGIVTRCPLILRLRKSNERKFYRIHAGNTKTVLDVNNLNVPKYIEEETIKIAGNQKNVVCELIELLVEDPNVRDLTVVDLPGIAYNPIADQPDDIHKRTIDLIGKFIKDDNSIILCVFDGVPTVETFTLARQADPNGLRTIGVITKCDQYVDDNALCQQLLMQPGNVIQLKLGFVAVRNRAHDEKITISDARKREEEFFQRHVASTAVGMHCLGVNALVNCLANLYTDRVKGAFPKLRNEIEKEYIDVCEQMKMLPEVLETNAARLSKYYEVADFYTQTLRDRLSNFGHEHASLLNTFHIKFQSFEEELETYGREFETNQYVDKIRKKMSACSGEQLSNFLPYILLKSLIQEKLCQLANAANRVAKDCYKATLQLLFKNENRPYKDECLMKKLRPHFRKTVTLFMSHQLRDAERQLMTLINHEKNDPYTMNSSYMSDLDRLLNTQPGRNTNDEYDIDNMLCSVRSYWRIITKRFVDYAALTIRTSFAFDVIAGICERIRSIPTEQRNFVDDHLSEDAGSQILRKNLQIKYEKYRKAFDILGGQLTIYSSIDEYSLDIPDTAPVSQFHYSLLPRYVPTPQNCSPPSRSYALILCSPTSKYRPPSPPSTTRNYFSTSPNNAPSTSSTNYVPPTSSTNYSPESPAYYPASPTYYPASPTYIPETSGYSPSSPEMYSDQTNPCATFVNPS